MSGNRSNLAAPQADEGASRSIAFQGRRYDVGPQETLLDALLRGGAAVPFSCRKGSCLTCRLTCLEGEVTGAARQGLRPAQIERGGFLACRQRPRGPMTVALPDEPAASTAARVTEKQILGPDVCLIRLRPETPFAYRPGQFVNLRADDGLIRSYSLASLPQQNEDLEIHVKRLPGGAVSGWLYDSVAPGDSLALDGPYGECHLQGEDPAQPILLIGTGTGLAPLLGVLRDALARGHRGPLRLYHGSRRPTGLYHHGFLSALARRAPDLAYHACVSGDEAPAGFRGQRAELAAFEDLAELSGWRVYLCGYPAMVQAAKRTAFLQGASLDEIHADPFDLQELRREPRPDDGPPRTDTW